MTEYKKIYKIQDKSLICRYKTTTTGFRITGVKYKHKLIFKRHLKPAKGKNANNSNFNGSK